MPKLRLFLLAGVVWPTAAGADPPPSSDVWGEASTLMEALEYDSAIEVLGRLVGAPEAPAADRLRALEVQGVAHVGAGRDDEAISVFRRLREMDPGHRLTDPTYSPKIRELFDRAVGSSIVRPLEVTLAPPGEGSRDVTLAIHFDPTIVAAGSVVFRSRWSDEGEYRVAPERLVAAGAEVRVPLVGRAPGVQRLRLFVLALAPSGATVGRAGTAESPVILEVRSVPATPGGAASAPLVERWYFWVGLGVLVAGGVAVAMVAAGGDSVREGTLGSQQMR
ncbi:MAG: hypothetical protein HYY06_15255 [Deltaproteobacteria bacterium]|nr:hypothetical protein [Deltaproteobacteria bacterium]